MNLRPKNLKDEVARTVWLLALLSSTFFAPPFASKALATNRVSIPVVVSLPSNSSVIEKSLVELGNSRFQEGFEFDQNFGDIAISDPFAIQLSGVRLKSKISGRLDRDSRGLIIEAMMQNPEITIDRISIHSVIETRVSGVEARIRIDAECTGSKVAWPRQTLAFFARGRLEVRPNLALDISSSALPADLAKPEMTLSCQGPFGMEKLIRDYAWTALQTRWLEDSFARDIETQLERAITSSIQVGGPGLRILNQANIQVTLRPDSYELDVRGGSHLRAVLDVNLDRPVVLPTEKAALIVLPTMGVQKITLSVASLSAQTLLQSWFAPQVWSEWIEGQKIEGFRDLMSSRFKQFFAFPDLMNYDKNAPFWFSLTTTDKPTLRCSANGLDVGVPIASWLLIKDGARSMGYKPLVYFNAPTRLAMTLPSLTNKRPMKASIASMSLQARFDDKYVREENPNTSLAIETIGSSVQEAAEAMLSAPESLAGGVGSIVKLLNRTDITCGATEQMLRVTF